VSELGARDTRRAAWASRAGLGALALAALSSCAIEQRAPKSPSGLDAGRAPAGLPSQCRAIAPATWSSVSHVSFPEAGPPGCLVPVRYRGDEPTADRPAPGCGYASSAPVLARLDREASRYEAIARGDDVKLPEELACALPREHRVAAARHNARAFRALAERLSRRERPFAYAAVATLGFGHPAMGSSKLTSYLPGDPCPSLDAAEMRRLGDNVVRAARGAQALVADVGPVLLVSGGAVHSRLNEAFMLHYLARCRFGAKSERVVLEPCADHTHTNLRYLGGLVAALGGRTAYVVTDDGLQSGYLQDWNVFHLLGGSLDQRSRRDFGFVVGSFRRASEGMKAGYWLTPYRFWGEPSPLGDLTCMPRE
jgi:hypothetical protein